MPILKSYVSPKVILKKSNVHKLGYYAKNNIKKGEIVFVKGGHIAHRKEIFASSVINSCSPLGSDLFICALTSKEEPNIKLYVNHSCNPNCGIRGEITYVTIKSVKKGEELTIDYAMLDNEPYKFKCSCSSKNCRKVITGFDWKKPELQKKYRGYFARYLQDKIDKKNKN